MNHIRFVFAFHSTATFQSCCCCCCCWAMPTDGFSIANLLSNGPTATRTVRTMGQLCSCPTTAKHNYTTVRKSCQRGTEEVVGSVWEGGLTIAIKNSCCFEDAWTERPYGCERFQSKLGNSCNSLLASI